MKKRTLSDMAIITMGQSPDSSSYNENCSGLPFFQGNAGFGDVHPHTQIFCSSPKKTAIPGDVLISVRAPIGAVNIADQKCCIGRGLAAITPLSDSNTGFIFYFLKSKTKILQSKGTGTTFKAIGKDILGKLSFPDYPLSQQKQIAMRLDKIQELVSLQKEQIRKLEQLVKSRFMEMFGDPMLSTKFPRATLRNCGIWQTGGTPSRQHPEYFGGKQPWITTIALNKLYVGKENAVDFITDIGLKNSSTKIIPPNSLLFAIRVAVGRVSINICELCTNQDIVSLTLKSIKQWNLTYLYFMFRLSERYFIDKSRGATIKGITSDVIKDFPIIAAPLPLQKQFAEFVEKAETQKALLEKRLNRLETLYKSLMQQYFG